MTGTEDTSGQMVWAAGLLVAAGAGAATAHGLYEVAVAARVPTLIAWLYPLITDGLALVAYAATSRLVDGGRRYAATIVVLAASLSGLAQAVYLAGGIGRTGTAPAGLRFGVGAWPAFAAALTAHLIHLVGATSSWPIDASSSVTHSAASVQSSNPNALDVVHPARTTAEPHVPAVQRPRTTASSTTTGIEANPGPPKSTDRSSARERARAAARGHYARHGRLPTVSQLVDAAQVARGTAGTVLKDLRVNRPALQLVNAEIEQETDQ